MTEWKEYRALDPAAVSNLVEQRSIIDGRNCLDSILWAQAGWEYRGMGRPTPTI